MSDELIRWEVALEAKERAEADYDGAVTKRAVALDRYHDAVVALREKYGLPLVVRRDGDVCVILENGTVVAATRLVEMDGGSLDSEPKLPNGLIWG